MNEEKQINKDRYYEDIQKCTNIPDFLDYTNNYFIDFGAECDKFINFCIKESRRFDKGSADDFAQNFSHLINEMRKNCRIGNMQASYLGAEYFSPLENQYKEKYDENH